MMIILVNTDGQVVLLQMWIQIDYIVMLIENRQKEVGKNIEIFKKYLKKIHS